MRLFIIYAGPKNSVCGMTQEKLRGILNKSTPSATIIHPYKSIPIKVGRTVLFCSVTFYGHRILSTRRRQDNTIASHINRWWRCIRETQLKWLIQTIWTMNLHLKQLQLFNKILIKVKNFGKIDVTELNFILMKK